MSPQRHTILGLFFLAAIGVLGYYTLFRADFNPFQEKHKITVYFEDAGGLREGDAILVAGMRWGKVEGLRYDAREERGERRIQADLVLTQKVTLYQNHAITIEDASILGGKVLRIEPGNPSQGLQPAGDLYGTVPPNPINAVGKMVEENREPLRNTLQDLSSLMAEARSGKGVLGALFSDETLRTDLTQAVSSVRGAFERFDAIATDIRDGNGTVSRLIKEDGVYNQLSTLGTNLDAFVTDARAVLDDVRAGKGTVGALLYDEATAERVRTTLDDISAVTSRLRLGEGTIGRLLTDPTVA
ncbi:MAG TPA: MlaD family protein, partial [Planctomycetota bacterium]|nr:MlaD family protein [Planctomycetota bacterium]